MQMLAQIGERARRAVVAVAQRARHLDDVGGEGGAHGRAAAHVLERVREAGVALVQRRREAVVLGAHGGPEEGEQRQGVAHAGEARHVVGGRGTQLARVRVDDVHADAFGADVAQTAVETKVEALFAGSEDEGPRRRRHRPRHEVGGQLHDVVGADGRPVVGEDAARPRRRHVHADLLEHGQGRGAQAFDARRGERRLAGPGGEGDDVGRAARGLAHGRPPPVGARRDVATRGARSLTARTRCRQEPPVALLPLAP